LLLSFAVVFRNSRGSPLDFFSISGHSMRIIRKMVVSKRRHH